MNFENGNIVDLWYIKNHRYESRENQWSLYIRHLYFEFVITHDDAAHRSWHTNIVTTYKKQQAIK